MICMSPEKSTAVLAVSQSLALPSSQRNGKRIARLFVLMLWYQAFRVFCWAKMSRAPGARLIAGTKPSSESCPRGVTHFCAAPEFAGFWPDSTALLVLRFPHSAQDARPCLAEQGRRGPDENSKYSSDGVFADGQMLFVLGKPVDHDGSLLSLSRISFRWFENKGGLGSAVAQQIAMRSSLGQSKLHDVSRVLNVVAQQSFEALPNNGAIGKSIAC